MSIPNVLTALPLSTGGSLVADETGTGLSLSLEGQPLISLHLTREPELLLQLPEGVSMPRPSSGLGRLLLVVRP